MMSTKKSKWEYQIFYFNIRSAKKPAVKCLKFNNVRPSRSRKQFLTKKKTLR